MQRPPIQSQELTDLGKQLIAQLKMLSRSPFIIDRGICLGISSLSLYAILADKIETFNAQIIALSKIPSTHIVQRVADVKSSIKPIDKKLFYAEVNQRIEEADRHLTQEEQYLLSCESFFRHLERLQFLEGFPNIRKAGSGQTRSLMTKPQSLADNEGSNISDFTFLPPSPSFSPMLPIEKKEQKKEADDLTTHYIKEASDAVSIGTILVDVYEGEKLAEYIEVLRHELVEQKPPFEEPLAFQLHDVRHAITIGWNPKTQVWYFIDVNQLPVSTFQGKTASKELAQKIYQAFGQEKNILISMRMHVKTSQTVQGNQFMQRLEKKQEITDAKAGIKDSRQFTLLHLAAVAGAIDFTKMLFSKKIKVDIDAKASEGYSAFHVAAREGRGDIVQVFLENHATVDLEAADGATALYHAANKGHAGVVKQLLQAGARINGLVKDVAISNWFAAHNKSCHIVNLLLAAGAKIEFPAVEGILAPRFTQEAKFDYFITLLLQARKQLNSSVCDTEDSSMAAVKKLLAAGKTGKLPDIDTIAPYLAEEKDPWGVVRVLFAAAKQGRLSAIHDILFSVPTPSTDDLNLLGILFAAGANVSFSIASGSSALYAAARKGYFPVVQTLLGGGSTCDLRTMDGIAVLYAAAKNGHRATVQALWRKIRESVEKGKLAYTLDIHELCHAIQENHFDTIMALLRKGVTLPQQTVAENSHQDIPSRLLCAAVEEGHLAFVEMLLEEKADVDSINDKGETPLQLAARCNHLNMAALLLARRATIDSRSFSSYLTPLHLAAKNGHRLMVELLLRTGRANVNASTWDGLTPFHFAAQRGDVLILELLHKENVKQLCKEQVRRAADTTILSFEKTTDPLRSNGLTCLSPSTAEQDIARLLPSSIEPFPSIKQKSPDDLHHAGRMVYPWILGDLTPFAYADRYGKLIDCAPYDGSTPLHLAAENGHFEAVDKLLEWELVNAQRTGKEESIGITPLHLAARNGHTNVVMRLLFAPGIDADPKSLRSFTPLHFAAFYGHVQIVELLLGRGGANPSSQCVGGVTPLHFAVKNGYASIVEQLLRRKAAVNLRECSGLTPLHFAAERGHVLIVERLLEEKADISLTRREDGFTPLHFAAENGHIAIVEQLFRRGEKVDVKAKFGFTALHLAAENGHVSLVKRLVEAGASIDSSTSSKTTPLLLAADKGHFFIVEYLVSRKAAVTLKDVKGEGTPLYNVLKKMYRSAANKRRANLSCFSDLEAWGEKALQEERQEDYANVVELLHRMKTMFPSKMPSPSLSSSRFFASEAAPSVPDKKTAAPLPPLTETTRVSLPEESTMDRLLSNFLSFSTYSFSNTQQPVAGEKESSENYAGTVELLVSAQDPSSSSSAPLTSSSP